MELEAKLQSEKLAAQLELEKLQLEIARVERENIEARAEVQLAASSHVGQENVAAVTKTLGLSGFVNGVAFPQSLVSFVGLFIVNYWKP